MEQPFGVAQLFKSLAQARLKTAPVGSARSISATQRQTPIPTPSPPVAANHLACTTRS